MFHWLTQWFRGSRPATALGQAHMTFGQTSVGRSFSRTRLLLKKQLWVWPIIAVVLLAAIGYSVSSAIEQTMKANLRSELQTLLNVECSMLETWLAVQEANADSLAEDQQVRAVALEILAASHPPLTDTTLPAADPLLPA
ncbi:MAG TPA: serine/threonine protein kinase, partial [Pirellulaceae bacterium]|nr:serine/threonine protein kinase [Pirellulaceae bacterium]